MFNVDWMIANARSAPEPSSARRPALLRRAQLGRAITPEWSVDKQLRGYIGDYPQNADRLNFEVVDAEQDLPAEVGRPGSTEWARAIATLDAPAAAIPLEPVGRSRTVRFLRVFTEP